LLFLSEAHPEVVRHKTKDRRMSPWAVLVFKLWPSAAVRYTALRR
jgi:hypothetical protein